MKSTSNTDSGTGFELAISLLVLGAAGGWLGYRYLSDQPTALTSLDLTMLAVIGPALLVSLVSWGLVWRALHPGAPADDELDRWQLRFQVRAATVGTAAAAFAAAATLIRWKLSIALLPNVGIAAAAAIVAAAFTIENHQLHSRRVQVRSNLIQALYGPLGHKVPAEAVVRDIRWQPRSAVPETITIRASRPTNTRLTYSEDQTLDDDPKTTGRTDAATVIRRALKTHCGAHYKVSADPSGLRFQATHHVPEQLDEDLAELTRKVREFFGPTATVTGNLASGFTITHSVATKMTGEFRKRVAEQNLTELIGGNWVTTWDMQQGTVVFAPKPDLPRIVYPAPVPEVTSIDQAIAEYKQTRLPYGIDLDLNPQEWDPLDAPHTLVGGKTGAGKTVYLRAKIMQAARRGWAVVIVDFKGGSFSDLAGWPNVHIISSDPFESIATIHRMYKLMDERNAKARWNPKSWEKNLPYLLVIDEAAQFKVILTRLWESGLKPKGGPKEPPTVTEIAELARLSRTARIHLELGMQRPDHDLIDTEARDNFGNKVSVGPISRIAAEMLFEDSYTGRNVPRIKGRGMSLGTHETPRETQYYFCPAADTTNPDEQAVIASMRPSRTLIPRYVPQLPADLDSWSEIADAPWFDLAARPDLDPALVSRTITRWDGDATLGFDTDTEAQENLTVCARDLQPKDSVVIDGFSGEIDGIDVDDDGTVTIMWQKDDDGLLCMSSTSAGSPFDITRAQINSS